MFVDSVEIFIQSGKGGAGAVSFRREKFVLQGGPDGGDGGRGGSIYALVDRNTNTLAKFRGHRRYLAQNGAPGTSRNCHGKKGADLVLRVPPGTQVIDSSSGELLFDLVQEGQKQRLLEGGRGGLGNARFKSSTNQRPQHAQKGEEGSSLNVILELKLIADIALVGLPNAGKSSLISRLSRARPKIADYEFSTLVPNLGVVDLDGFYSFVMADIPGLIEGASEGLGLGLKFLRHIERTKLLLFLLDVSRCLEAADREEALLSQLRILQSELEKYSSGLSSRPYAIVLSKSDLGGLGGLGEFRFKHGNLCGHDFDGYVDRGFLDCLQGGLYEALPGRPLFVLPLSSMTGLNLEILKNLLFQALGCIGGLS